MAFTTPSCTRRCSASFQPTELRLRTAGAGLAELLEWSLRRLPSLKSWLNPAALMSPVTLSERQFRAVQSATLHVSHTQMSALTPLAGIKASSSAEFLTVWAILDTWTCTHVWHTCGLHLTHVGSKLLGQRVLAERKPYLGRWAGSSFEQGVLCALAAMSSLFQMFANQNDPFPKSIATGSLAIACCEGHQRWLDILETLGVTDSGNE